MNRHDAKDLRELCDKAIADVTLYENGTPYEQIGFANTFKTICTPLLQAGALDPDLKRATPPIKQYDLTRNLNILAGAMMFNRTSVLSEYLPALVEVRAALSRVENGSNARQTGNSTHRSVFYSWQATLPNSTNRGFIRECLEGSVKGLNSDVDLEDSVRVDSDTSGQPGSPKIFPTILSKIEVCDLFIADVSIVADKQCNSNVMVELGYALKVLGEERILMVFNQAYGDIRDLPFDLSFNKQILYRLGKDQEKSSARKMLTSSLKMALKTALV